MSFSKDRGVVSRLCACLVACLAFGCGKRPSERPRPNNAREALVWAEQTQLFPSDSAVREYFGASVAIHGTTALIGVPGRTLGADDLGAAYVFVRNGASWEQQAVLTPSAGAAPGEAFGSAVAISGDTALIGTGGKAYVFVRTENAWAQQGPPLSVTGGVGSGFGYAVALHDDAALIGAQYEGINPDQPRGAAYVFTRSGASWTQEGPALQASDAADGDFFGAAVALYENTALVSAPRNSAGNPLPGRAYVFTRSGTTWTEQGPALTAADATSFNGFGVTLSLFQDTALIGAPYNGDETDPPGAAYVFVRNGVNWSQQGPRLPINDSKSLFAGQAVAIYGDRAVIGGRRNQTEVGTEGALYFFTRQGTTWTKDGPAVSSSDSLVNDGFASSLALFEDNVLVGAPLHSLGGSAYSFTLLGGQCAQGADCASGFCANGVCCDSACDGGCEVCLEVLGAAQDGKCANAPGGYPGVPACAPLACTGSKPECSACANDNDCMAADYCAPDGSCTERKAVGAACDLAAGADCKVAGCRACAGVQNGYCADGVCCESVCDSPCDVCSQRLGSSADGQCEAAPEQSSGEPRCDNGSVCDGVAKKCPASCALDSDCAATHYCSAASGSCVPRIPLGGSCDVDDCNQEGCRICDGGVCLDSECLVGVPSPPPTRKSKGGCDCGVTPGAASDRYAVGWLAALLLTRIFRRRRLDEP